MNFQVRVDESVASVFCHALQTRVVISRPNMLTALMYIRLILVTITIVRCVCAAYVHSV